MAKREKERMRTSLNPWERVITQIDLSSGAHTRDVSRMKAAILARKADLTKQQTPKTMF